MLASMTPPPSWQDRNRRTLRFLDPALEREYQADAAVSSEQLRGGPLIAVGLWIAGALITPSVTHAPATPIYAIAAAMAVANLIGATVAPRARTLNQQQVLGTTLNILAGIAVLVVARLTSTFDQYGAPPGPNGRPQPRCDRPAGDERNGH